MNGVSQRTLKGGDQNKRKGSDSETNRRGIGLWIYIYIYKTLFQSRPIGKSQQTRPRKLTEWQRKTPHGKVGTNSLVFKEQLFVPTWLQRMHEVT